MRAAGDATAGRAGAKGASDGARPHARGWILHLGIGAAATAAYFAVHGGAADYLYSGITLWCVGAIVVGIRRRRPSQRWPWIAFGAGFALYAIGDGIFNAYELTTGAEPPFPSLADAFYLGFYPFIVAGVMLVATRRSPGRDRIFLVDALILMSSASLLAWVFLMAPYARDSSLTLAERLVSLAYPAMDLLVLAVALRLAVGRSERLAAGRFLLASVACNLAADVVYMLLILNGTYASQHPIDALWLASYVLWGAAALHPSMRALSDEAPASEPKRGSMRLAALGAAALVPPGVLIVGEARGGATEVTVAAIASAAIFLLVLARMGTVYREVEQSARRERESRLLAETLRQREQRFATMAAHELRTPVTALLGSLITVERLDDDAQERRELLAAAIRQTGRLARVCEDLLTVAEADRGMLDVHMASVELADALRDSIAELGGVARGRVRVHGPASLRATADRDRLTQVLTNVMRNALQYSTAGTQVDVEMTAAGGEVAVTVRDRGPGIPPERLPRIFDRFGERGPDTNARGLGVGLWVARELITLMGGTIEAHNEPRGGARFRIALPAATLPGAAALLSRAQRASSRSARSAHTTSARSAHAPGTTRSAESPASGQARTDTRA